MASAIRDFSYVFTYAKKLENSSTLSRILVALTAVTLAFLARLLSKSILVEAIRLSLVLALELIVVSYFRGFRPLIAALKLVMLFIAVGTAIFCASYFVGWAAPEPASILLGAVALLAFFLAFSLLFQLLSLKEWRRVFALLGSKKYALLFSLVISQIPVTIYYASEAFTTIKLKYGGRKLHRVVVPLVLLSLYNARSLLESHLLYGVFYEADLTLLKRKDLLLYSIAVPVIAAFTMLEYVPLSP
ncbi:MAG: hypothetical protein QXH02_01580 [Desulfurococcaceae archaeon]